MSIDAEALKNFQGSKFNFVDDNGKEPDYSKLSDDAQYSLRVGEQVVQDQMDGHAVTYTINNEWGKDENI